MITITDRENLRLSPGGSARFEGVEHAADVSFFWVDSAPGAGPDMHVHPYTETWVVLAGRAQIIADADSLIAGPGAVITAAAGTAHRFVSCGDVPLQMICIHGSATIQQDFVDESAQDTGSAGGPR